MGEVNIWPLLWMGHPRAISLVGCHMAPRMYHMDVHGRPWKQNPLREHGVMVTSRCYGYMLLKTRAIKPKLKFTLCIELLFARTNPTPRDLRASCLPCTQYKFTYGRGRGKTCVFFQVLIHGSPYVHYVPGQNRYRSSHRCTSMWWCDKNARLCFSFHIDGHALLWFI